MIGIPPQWLCGGSLTAVPPATTSVQASAMNEEASPTCRSSVQESQPQRAPHCGHCGEVIGVYEPAIAVIGGQALETSRAGDEIQASAEACFHRGCFERLSADTRPA
jgi:hypothetical protein